MIVLIDNYDSYSKLLLSIWGQKKAAITPMSNYGFILVLITFQVV